METLTLQKIPEIIRIEKISERNELKELPENISMFKCPHCRFIFDIFEPQCAPVLTIFCNKEDVVCPNCGMNGVELMCKIDSYSVFLKLYDVASCRKDVAISGVDLCPVCENPMCPECFNHSVVALSRVTGYIQDVSGWNAAKRQELKDRRRYDIDDEGNSGSAKKIDRIIDRIDQTREENIEKFDRTIRSRTLKGGQQYLNIYLT